MENAPNACAGATQSPLAGSYWFSPWAWKRATQRLWPTIMWLLADNGVRGEFGRTREPIPLLRCHLQTHATRGSHHTQPSPLIQASFLLLRLGGWCPPGGTPNVDKAFSILSLVNPICCNACMHCAFSLFGRFRYPVVGSDHVVGVWVVAQAFDHVAGEGWREFVCLMRRDRDLAPLPVSHLISSHTARVGVGLRPRWGVAS